MGTSTDGPRQDDITGRPVHENRSNTRNRQNLRCTRASGPATHTQGIKNNQRPFVLVLLITRNARRHRSIGYTKNRSSSILKQALANVVNRIDAIPESNGWRQIRFKNSTRMFTLTP
jgi:hypothetical protein